jgi:hypothetical protein
VNAREISSSHFIAKAQGLAVIWPDATTWKGFNNLAE